MVNCWTTCVNTVEESNLRHLKALSWMVSALICCGKLSLPEWEPYVPSRAQKAQSVERRWSRFLSNQRISVTALYVPLVLAALSGWQHQRLYLALNTTVLSLFCHSAESKFCFHPQFYPSGT